MASAPWMNVAMGEIGISEIVGTSDNPKIVEYHSTTTYKATNDETPWCASFVNWCLLKSGFRGTGSAAALSYKNFGRQLFQPEVGAIAVFERAGGGHVGFVYGIDGNSLRILGGNQGNRVSILNYNRSAAIVFRWPA